MQRAALTKQLYGAPTQFAAANKKFAVGKNPLELESELDVIQPQNAQQQKRMVEVMEALYKDAKNDPAKRVALEMWRMQLQSADAESLVKTDFQKRFYFWLLGRGTKEDTDKTFWGRGNMAAHNPEVAAYIDQFLESRANYAMQLALLANRAPTSLLGAYLYFKYIVNGNLKQTTKGDKTWWHLDQSDYLEDFDLFRKYFDKVPDGNGGERPATRDDQYSKLVQPQEFRAEVDPSAPANAGQEPYPVTSEQKETWALKDDAGIKESIGMVEAETEDPLWNSQWGINPDKPPKKPKPGRPLPGGASEDPVPSAGAANLPANVATVDSAAIAAQVAASLAEERRQRAVVEAGERAAKTERKQRKQELKQQRHDAMMEALRRNNQPPPPTQAASVAAPPVRDEAWLEEQRRNLEQFHATGRAEMQTWMTNTLAGQRAQMEERDRLFVAELAKFGANGRDDGKLAEQLGAQHTATLNALAQLGADLRGYRPETELVRNLPDNKAELEAIRREFEDRQRDADRERDAKTAQTLAAVEARQREMDAEVAAARKQAEEEAKRREEAEKAVAEAGERQLRIAQAANADAERMRKQQEAREEALVAAANASAEARERQHRDELALATAQLRQHDQKLQNATRMLAEDTDRAKREMAAELAATAAKIKAEADAQSAAERERLRREAADREVTDKQKRDAEHAVVVAGINKGVQSQMQQAAMYIQKLQAENESIRKRLAAGEAQHRITDQERIKLEKAYRENEVKSNRAATKLKNSGFDLETGTMRRPKPPARSADKAIEALAKPPVAAANDKGNEELSEPVKKRERPEPEAPVVEAPVKKTETPVAVEEPRRPSRVKTRGLAVATKPAGGPAQRMVRALPPREVPAPAATRIRIIPDPTHVPVTRSKTRAEIKTAVETPPTVQIAEATAPPMATEKDVKKPVRAVARAVKEKITADVTATEEDIEEAATAQKRAQKIEKKARSTSRNAKKRIAEAVGNLRDEMAMVPVEPDKPKAEQVAEDWEALHTARDAALAAGVRAPEIDHSKPFGDNLRGFTEAMYKVPTATQKKVKEIHAQRREGQSLTKRARAPTRAQKVKQITRRAVGKASRMTEAELQRRAK